MGFSRYAKFPLIRSARKHSRVRIIAQSQWESAQASFPFIPGRIGGRREPAADTTVARRNGTAARP